MDWTNISRRSGKFVRVSGSLTGILFASWIACYPSIVSSQDAIENPIAATTAHFRTKDVWRPRLGFFLDSETFEATGMNFQFCDGDRSFIEQGNLEPSAEICDEFRGGTFSIVDIVNFKEAVPIYTSDYTLIGKITEINLRSPNQWYGNVDVSGYDGELPETFIVGQDGKIFTPIVTDLSDSDLSYNLTKGGNVEAVITESAPVRAVSP